MKLVLGLIFLGLLVLTVCRDLRSGLILNVYLVLLLAVKLLMIGCDLDITAGSENSVGGMIEGAVNAVLVILLLFPFFSIGAIGAGDLKLIAIAMLGVAKPMLFTLAVFLFAALAGLVLLVVNGNLSERIDYLVEYVKDVFFLKTALPYNGPQGGGEELKTHCIHLSVPVFITSVLFFITENTMGAL